MAEPSRAQGSSRCSLPTFPQYLQTALARSDTAAVFFLVSSCSQALAAGAVGSAPVGLGQRKCAWIGKSDQQAKTKTTES